MTAVDGLQVVDVDVAVCHPLRLQVEPCLVKLRALVGAEAGGDHLLVHDVHGAVDVDVRFEQTDDDFRIAHEAEQDSVPERIRKLSVAHDIV